MVAVKVDIDRPANRAVVQQFGVSGIPAMHLVDTQGQPVAGVLGDVSVRDFLAEFDPFVSQSKRSK